MHSMGRDIGSEIIVRNDVVAAGGAVATSVGRGVNIATLAGRPNSVRALVSLRANLDTTDTYVADNIKLVSDTSSSFSAPVTRVTAADITLTGVTAADQDFFADAALDLDLGQLPESHVWLRVSARHTLADTTNTNGSISATFVFGGLALS